MKFTSLTTLSLLFTLGTASAQNTCGVNNPATDLPWLAEMLQGACQDNPCIEEVFQGTYMGQTVFFNQDPINTPCADFQTLVLDCNGDMICFFGGIAGGNGEGCPLFFETVSDRTPLCGLAQDAQHLYYDLYTCPSDVRTIGLGGQEGNVTYQWPLVQNDSILSCSGCSGECTSCYSITVSPDTSTEFVLHTFYTLANEHTYFHYRFHVTTDCTPPACVDSSLINQDIACIALYDPVCGCDGKTYGNSCEALNWYGVTSWVMGECTNATHAPAKNRVKIGPNPTQDELMFQYAQLPLKRIEIVNAIGQVQREAHDVPADIYTMHLDGLQNGVYYVRCYWREGMDVQAVVKMGE